MKLRNLLNWKSRSYKRPLVLQMPVTSRCNSRCKTCNIWKNTNSVDIDSHDLRLVLQSPIYSNVRTVGLNGGEFTLHPNFIQVIESVLSLHSLSSIYLITNGLFPKKLFELLRKAKKLCDTRKVSLFVGISVDGAKTVHEHIRGIPNCFKKTEEIINELYKNKEPYCNNFSVICTLSKYNIAFVRETEYFLEQYKDISIEYQLAVPNLRIKTYDDFDSYYVLSDERARMLALEFFYEKYKTSSNTMKKQQCFVIYHFLKNKGKGRLCKCNYLDRDLTIDEHLNLSLCATASRTVGNVRNEDSIEIINSSSFKQERKRIERLCNSCIHYSDNPLNFRGRVIFINEIIHDMYIYQWYKIASQNKIYLKKSFYSFIKRITYDYLKLIYIYLWRLR